MFLNFIIMKQIYKPFTPKSAKWKIRKPIWLKFHYAKYWKTNSTMWILSWNSFNLNGYTLGFLQQTKNVHRLISRQNTQQQMKALLESFCMNGHTLGFIQTKKVRTTLYSIIKHNMKVLLITIVYIWIVTY